MKPYIKAILPILLLFVVACQSEPASQVEPAITPRQMEVQITSESEAIDEAETDKPIEPAHSVQSESEPVAEQTEPAEFSPSPISTQIIIRTDSGSTVTSLVINFNQAMEQSSVSQALSITPQVDYSVEWPAADQMTVTFAQRLDATVDYSAALNTSAVNLNGRPLLNDYEITFKSFVKSGEPRIFKQPVLHSVAGFIDQVVPLTSTETRFDPIRINFSQNVDRASAEEAFVIRPNMGGEIEWRDNTFLFWPDEPLAFDSTVEFGFNGTLLDADNQPLLNQPEFWSVKVPEGDVEGLGKYHYALATFGPDFQLDTNQKFEALEANGDRLIEFRFIKPRPTEITFNLYPAEIDQLFQPEPSLPGNIAPAYTWQHITSINLDSVNNIDQATVPANVPPGLYLLEVDATHDKDLITLLITDYSLIAKGSEDNVSAWVQNHNGEQVGSGTTTVWNDQGVIVSQQPINGQGVAQHAFSTAGSDRPFLLTAEIDGQLTLTGLTDDWDVNVQSLGADWVCGLYDRWGGWGYAEKRYDTIFQPDRLVYTPGSTVYFKTFIRKLDGGLQSANLAGTPVRVEAGASANPIFSEEFIVSDFGTVSGSFWLPDTMTNGWLQLRLTIEGEQTLEFLSISTAGNNPDFERPIFEEDEVHPPLNGGDFTIRTNKDKFVSRELAQVTIESTFGGPALLLVERGEVRRYEEITLTPPTTQVELTIAESDAPNVFVTVSAYQPIDSKAALSQNLESQIFSISDQVLRTATTEIFSAVQGKNLNVQIIPNKSTYGSGEEATFEVVVTNEQGVPVSAEVSLVLQEEAIQRIYPLSEEQSLDQFYVTRPYTVNTFHTFAGERYLGPALGGGCNGLKEQPDAPEISFRPETAWTPNLVTDFEGKAQATFTPPASAGRWRIMATAITADTQIGEAEIIIETN